MENLRNLIRSILFRIGQFEMLISVIILIGIVLMIFIQVLLNSGLGRPILWEQEAGAYGLVWITFLGASIALKQMRHVTIVSFVGRLNFRLRNLVRAIVWAIVLFTIFSLIRELKPIMQIEARANTVTLPFDLPRSYFFSVPLLLSCYSMALTAGLFLFESLLGLLSLGSSRQLLEPIRDEQV
mgnify:FL=1